MPSEMEKLGGIPSSCKTDKPRFNPEKFEKWMEKSAGLIMAAGLESESDIAPAEVVAEDPVDILDEVASFNSFVRESVLADFEIPEAVVPIALPSQTLVA